MGTFTYTDLVEVDLGKLKAARTQWANTAEGLKKLAAQSRDGLVRLSDGAKWAGLNATVTQEFVRRTAKEFTDLHTEATSIAKLLEDAYDELSQVQKQAKQLSAEAREGNQAGRSPTPALLVMDGPGGTVKVMEAVCDVDGTSQRTKDLMQWYADTLTGLVSHAAEIDASLARSLSRSHGNDPHDAGHGSYTSLDQDQLPRATKLASLGEDANKAQRAELHRLFGSLSPSARSRLWSEQKDGLLAAGLLTPTVKQIAADRGAGPYGIREPNAEDRRTRETMNLIAEGADWGGMNDASRNMAHYLGNSGTDMDLPVDKMMLDDAGFEKHVRNLHIDKNKDEWHAQALAEFRRNGGQPVAFPVETRNEDYSFNKETQRNWFYAVGSTRSNVTGVVTVVPDENGRPRVGLDYQANAWDRYNWDEGKGVTIGPMSIPDGQMARLHNAGIAQEYNMAGSSSVKHYDLGGEAPNSGPLPGPEEPGREGSRTDLGREQQEGR
ncbi:hypothetical protein ACFYVL_27015 [Streptomyces sp. NPDC004111]|uniref:hypothetical protein n=1 Tax=Streptomyces sp. NPDC004111 TaxID=3364690 RepID=UPI0036BFE7FA